MQRFLFLFLLLVFNSCQNLEEKNSTQSIGQLLNTYQKLPTHYQRLDLAELLFLKPVAQKVWLKQALDEAKLQRLVDSVQFSFLEQPFTDFYGSCITWAEQPGLSSDSTEILVHYSQALTTEVEVHYLGATGFYYKYFRIDPDCNPTTGGKPLTLKCFSLLSEKKLPSNTNQLADLKDYLEKCDFLYAPARFEKDCLDGDYITIYVKEGNRFKVVSAYCPDELQPLRVILNKVKNMLEVN